MALHNSADNKLVQALHRPLRMTLRYLLSGLWLAATLSGCTTLSIVPSDDWEHRLRGDSIVLLGEIHDNAEHHQLRLDVLRRALVGGWRPAIAMEQFDRERQDDIDRARREKPHDAQYVIDLAGLAVGASRGNWHWDFYRPFVALALEFDVPLIAVNLSNADITKVVRGGYEAVFDAESKQALGLAAHIPAALQAAQERAIEAGHCNALPPTMVPAMTRGQLARDAVMASIVSQHAAQGVVLLAGNGHVRRNTGVPRWLSSAKQAQAFVVGYLEHGNPAAVGTEFDAVVRVAAIERTDPCIAFRNRSKSL